MKNEPEYLSQPKLLRSAQELGLDLNERTLQFYVKRGLLPKGLKNPYNGADGRAVYWPSSVLKRVRRIFQLKQQGLKLEQIRLSLEGGSRLPVADIPAEDWRREVAYRFLKLFLSGQSRQLRLEIQSQRPDTEAAWLQALRHYQRVELTPLIGEEAAQQWVEQFFLELHPNELARHVDRFRADLGPGQAPRSWVAEVGAATRQVVTQFLLGRLDQEAYVGYLQAQQKLFGQALRRVLRLSDPASACAASALRELATILKALGETGATKQDIKKALGRYAQGLERLQVASQVETQLLWLKQFDPCSTSPNSLS